MPLRDYTFLGTTQSLCPECLSVVPAKIVARNQRVYFRKHCCDHGSREDYVCSDVRWFDQLQYSVPGKLPRQTAVEPRRGCPYDCGLCDEHEQHTCIGLLEITSACNLQCPLCYAASGPGGQHLSLDECRRAIDHLVAAEGRPEVLQLSGGEPTIHPEFLEIFRAACDQPIDTVMINTNGIRFAHDARLVDEVAQQRHRTEIYLQWDGFDDQIQVALRGESLTAVKMQALERLGQAGLRVTLVCTVEAGVNDHQIGRIVQFGVERPWVTGISFQPATYVGRYVLPAQLERRVTFPDVIRAVARQTGLWNETDFLPLPCAHPNGHSLAYAYRTSGNVIPLTRFIDIHQHLDLLANGIAFTRQHGERLIRTFLERSACGSDCGCGEPIQLDPKLHPLSPNDPLPATGETDSLVARYAEQFFRKALSQQLSTADVFRITTTSFMDAYNFDIRQLMKSCVHHVLPSGHIIPFSAYNVLYRDGHVPLPPTRPVAASSKTRQWALRPAT